MTILPQLERDLFNAADERLRPNPKPSRRRSTWLPRSFRRGLKRATASGPLILSVAVVIAVAVVAIALLGHGHQASQSTTPTGPSGGSPRAELIRTLGILRRPQTNADLDREVLGLYLRTLGPGTGTIPPRRYIPFAGPTSVLKRWGDPELDRPLARVVGIPAWSAKVLIAPTRFRPSPSSPKTSEGLNLALRIGTAPTIPPSSLSGTGPRPTSVGKLLAHGLALADAAHGTHILDAVVLVPDGVTSVKLGPFVSLPHETPPGVSGKALSMALASIQGSASVQDNVGAFQLAMPVVTSRSIQASPPGRPRAPALFGMDTKAQDTWFDSRGRVIKRTTTQVGLIVRVQQTRAR